MRRIERKRKPTSTQKKSNKEPFFKGVQAKVTIGEPNDHYEKEADAMADAVTSGGATNAVTNKTTSQSQTQAKPLASQITPLVQRATEEEAQTKVQRQEEEEAAQPKIQRMEEEEAQAKIQLQEEEEAAQPKIQRMEEEEAQTKVQKQEEEEAAQAKVQRMEEEEPAQAKIQRQEEEEAAQAKLQRAEDEEVQGKNADNPIVKPSMEATLKSKKGSGSAMDAKTKAEMETGFGADFSGVRIHTDSKSQEMNQEIGAQAFTHGNDVYFNEGKYKPESQEGKHLLAHELTHTIQQNGAKKIQKQDTPPTTTTPTTPVKTPATPAAKKSTLFADSLAKLKTICADCHTYLSKATLNGGLATIKKESYSGTDLLFKLNLKTMSGGGSVLALFSKGSTTPNKTAKPPNITVDMSIDLDATILTAASTPALVDKFARDMYHESLHLIIYIDSQRSDLLGSSTLDSTATKEFKTYLSTATGLPEYTISKTELEVYIQSKFPKMKASDVTFFAVNIIKEIIEERHTIGKADKAFGTTSGTNNDIALTYLNLYLNRMSITHSLTDKDFMKLYKGIGGVLTKADAKIAKPKKKTTP